MTDKLERFGRRPLFAVDGVTFTWSDVLARSARGLRATAASTRKR